ncbi:hypothetical protein BEN30_13680 [Magnetovibrio blakemorei]|uniref:Cytochrome C n=2 Tax=Magnetovibrio blakemorei TaxID=28181 RepID=A0A1E5Q5J6_9PROT|nr:hypothetical protein BEN30_13680 [Magnetovibrio blakemorei]
MRPAMKKTVMVLGAALILNFGLPLSMAHADGYEREGREREGGEREGGGRASMVVTDALVKKECSDCHMAYPPALLPSNTWRTIMENLPNHFGEDASLNDATRTRIETYLVQNSPRGGAANPLRISEQRWFKGEHRGDINRWSRGNANSWAKCEACHQGAERGWFDDD